MTELFSLEELRFDCSKSDCSVYVCVDVLLKTRASWILQTKYVRDSLLGTESEEAESIVCA